MQLIRHDKATNSWSLTDHGNVVEGGSFRIWMSIRDAIQIIDDEVAYLVFSQEDETAIKDVLKPLFGDDAQRKVLCKVIGLVLIERDFPGSFTIGVCTFNPNTKVASEVKTAILEGKSDDPIAIRIDNRSPY